MTACQTDVTSLSFDDDQFNVVTMLEVLEQIPETDAGAPGAAGASQGISQFGLTLAKPAAHNRKVNH